MGSRTTNTVDVHFERYYTELYWSRHLTNLHLGVLTYPNSPNYRPDVDGLTPVQVQWHTLNTNSLYWQRDVVSRSLFSILLTPLTYPLPVPRPLLSEISQNMQRFLSLPRLTCLVPQTPKHHLLHRRNVNRRGGWRTLPLPRKSCHYFWTSSCNFVGRLVYTMTKRLNPSYR